MSDIKPPRPDDFDVIADACRDRYERGETIALLDMIAICGRMGRPLPAWTTEAFIARLQRLTRYEVRSMDEAFDHKLPDKKHLFRLNLKYERKHEVISIVDAARERGESVNAELFERVGASCGLSGSTCSKLYYQWRREDRYWRSTVHKDIQPDLEKMDLGPIVSLVDGMESMLTTPRKDRADPEGPARPALSPVETASIMRQLIDAARGAESDQDELHES